MLVFEMSIIKKTSIEKGQIQKLKSKLLSDQYLSLCSSGNKDTLFLTSCYRTLKNLQSSCYSLR